MAISLDILVLAGIFVPLFLFAFFMGKEKLIALMVAIYIAAILYSYFPYLDQFKGSPENTLVFKGIVFLVLISAPYVILSRLESNGSSPLTSRACHSGLLALGALILVVFVSYHVIPLHSLYNFSLTFDNLFQPAEVRFWWLAAPLLLMFPTLRR
ncbi:MAG: hypothetical protein Q7S15_01150 [bacterium]|nr:hypothetical protein [bacterium]